MREVQWELPLLQSKEQKEDIEELRLIAGTFFLYLLQL